MDYIRSQPKLLKYEPWRYIGNHESFPIWGTAGNFKIGGQWNVYNAGVEEGPHRYNLKMANDLYADRHPHIFTGPVNSSGYTSNNAPDVHDDTWGIGLHFYEQPGEYVNDVEQTGAEQGTWQPTPETRYKFWCTYLYDEEKQESHPTEFIMYPSYAGQWPEILPDIASEGEHIGYTPEEAVEPSAGPPGTVARYGTRGTILGWGVPEMYFQKCRMDSNLETARLTRSIQGLDTPSTGTYGTNDGIQINSKVHFAPYVRLGVHSGEQEFMMGGPSWPHAEGSNDQSGGTDIYGSHSGNQRIRGARIYWSSNEDNHANLYCMFDMDWEKGIRSYGMEDPGTYGAAGEAGSIYGSWQGAEYIPGVGTAGKHRIPTGKNVGAKWRRANYSNWGGFRPDWAMSGTITDPRQGPWWYSPPKDVSYEELNGFKHTTSITARWKASVVINDVVYIGGYERPLWTHSETGSHYEMILDYTLEHFDNASDIGVGDLHNGELDDPSFAGTNAYNLLRGGTFY